MIDDMSVNELEELICGWLKIGGSGDPESVIEKLRDLLALSESEKWDSRFELLGDNPDGWMWLSVLEIAGLVEHGTSIRCSWRTYKGDRTLAALRKYGCDPAKWSDRSDIAPDIDGDGLGRCSSDCPQYQRNQDHTCCALGEWKMYRHSPHEDPSTDTGECPSAICPVWVKRGRNALLRQVAACSGPVAMLYVDHVEGCDATGQRGNPDRKFATVQAAVDASRPGDTISLSAGACVESPRAPGEPYGFRG